MYGQTLSLPNLRSPENRVDIDSRYRLKPYSVEPSGRSSPTSRCPADVNAFFLRPKRVDAILVSDAVVVPPLEFVPFRIDTVTFTSLYVPLALFVDDSPKRPSRPASLQNFGREFAGAGEGLRAVAEGGDQHPRGTSQRIVVESASVAASRKSIDTSP